MKVKLLLLAVLTLFCLLPATQAGVHRQTFVFDVIVDGSVTSKNANYTVAWQASSGWRAQNQSGYSLVKTGHLVWAGQWQIHRGFFSFDTRDIKKGWRVESATLDIDISGIDGTGWTVKLQKWMDTDDLLTVVDFSANDSFTYDDSSVSDADLSDFYDVAHIPVRDDNLIIKNGYTKIVMRLDTEMTGQEPLEDEFVQWFCGHSTLTVNVAWGQGKVKRETRGMDILPFAVVGVAICGGISFVALKRDELKRSLYQ